MTTVTQVEPFLFWIFPLGHSLVRESVLIVLTPSCQDSYQVVGDYCVKCGQGYSYSVTAGVCTLCPIASCGAGRYYSSSSLGCQDCQIGYYQPARGKFSCIACDPGLTTYNTGSTLKSKCIPTAASAIIDKMTTAEIAAVVIVPCFVQEKIVPEGPTEWQNVNKYGEIKLSFVSYKLNDLRAKRGVKPLEKQPIIQKIPEYSEIPRFTEKLQRKAKQRKPVIMANNQVTSHMNHELPPIKIKKSRRGKRKSRKHQREYDDDPMMNAPPSDTQFPKPLPARPPSDGSFNTSSSYLHAQNQSFSMSPEYMNSKSQMFKTSVASSHHYDEISPRHGPGPLSGGRPSDNKIHIDSDDDMR
ncbi:hypothetical protein KUTeg_006315 [Tegillarca granosa]|uniref:Tyrosine-protein kinase ephrin type A/B receptor-like domain-containing protein n=1 Tax=Tegillarca granosa TaxID=220873 RepID=A0ABQ9FJE9_TEGGR|nr:hypothetical protein KUTeg_006315 [Tegillarca granosa]